MPLQARKRPAILSPGHFGESAVTEKQMPPGFETYVVRKRDFNRFAVNVCTSGVVAESIEGFRTQEEARAWIRERIASARVRAPSQPASIEGPTAV